MSLLAFGEVLIDFLSNGGEPETFSKYPGGAPANVAVAYAKLGGNSAFVGMLGQDMFGEFLLTSLQQHNVNTEYCVQTSVAKTALAFVSLDNKGERSFSFYRPPAADLLFLPSHFNPSAFANANIFHICSNSLTEQSIYQTTLAGIENAKAHHCVVSFDINLRLNLWSDTSEINNRIWHCIEQVDVLKLSDEELSFMQQSTISKADFIQRCLSAGVKLVVLTCGSKPVQYFTSTIQAQVNIPLISVRDTTAAGDAFVGGLLFKLQSLLESNNALKNLVNNKNMLEETLNFATACGAIACTQLGAFPSLPSLDDYQAFIQSPR